MINIELDNPVLNAYMLFMQTAHAVQKYADAYFYRKVGLSSSKFVMMQILAVNEGTMTPSRISRWILKERHNVTTLVDRMKKDGLVREERSTSDKRSVNIILTGKGRDKLAQATPVAQEIVDRVMASIDERSITGLMKSLNILRQNAYTGIELISR